jgi:hypothetical protein
MTTAETIIAIVVSITTILSSLIVGVRWLVKHYFDEIKHELKPNSGKSLKDQVNRMEQDICDIKSENARGEEAHVRLDNKIDHLTQMFVEYVSNQSKKN